MIVKQYIKEFEKLGFGMFVHFGIYSNLGKGEWVKNCYNINDEDYYVPLMEEFDPTPNWAIELVTQAKKAGCKYITLTTRHHDGFSLFDTCGLSDLDVMHAKCKRDLVMEFVNACRDQEIVPFFYHTLLDWYQESYKEDFKSYLEYLRKSIEILCTNYGKIGGLWFDGMWDKKEFDWEEDALYQTIRKYQPDAMIINNTGLSALGELGHIELDSVTFERGKPSPINRENAQKYVASEMCEIFGSHWAYAKEDLNYKAPSQLIKELVECRRYGANMLLNIGPMGDGTIRPIDVAYLEMMGHWVNYFDEAIRAPRPVAIEIHNKPEDFLLRDGQYLYLFCHKLSTRGDINVSIIEKAEGFSNFDFGETIKHVEWLDNGETVSFSQREGKVSVDVGGYLYGQNLVVRVAKITLES